MRLIPDWIAKLSRVVPSPDLSSSPSMKKPLRAHGPEGFCFCCRVSSGLPYLRADQVFHHLVLIFLGDFEEAQAEAAAILVFGDLLDPCDLTQAFDGGVEGWDQQIDADVDLSHQQGGDPVEAGDLAVKKESISAHTSGDALEDGVFLDFDLFGKELVAHRKLGVETHEFFPGGKAFGHGVQSDLLGFRNRRAPWHAGRAWVWADLELPYRSIRRVGWRERFGQSGNPMAG